MKKMMIGFVGIAMVGMLTACGTTTTGNDIAETQTKETQIEETVTQETPETEEQTVVSTETDAATDTETDETVPAETESETAQDVTMDDIAALLEAEDDKVADFLGGGEENWTDDKSFYIGRIYNTSLDGNDIKVLTSVEDNVVKAVSVWLEDGEQTLAEEDVQNWVSYLTSWIGTEAEYDDTTSEAGSKIWKWKLDETFVKLFQNGDILTVTLNPAVGELN